MKKDSDAQVKVDAYIAKVSDDFRPICERLREIFLSEGLVEEVKWGAPCYSHHGLVCSIAAFKSYAGTWFFKGALLNDPENRFRQAQKDTKGLRSLTFEGVEDIDEKLLRGFVKEAMLLNEKDIRVPGSGKKKPLTIPALLEDALNKNPSLKEKFEAFSLSKKREFTEWIEEAKREATKQKRLEQSIELISKGIGRHDKYRK
ncbi:MAG: hypothetical protein HKN79_11875 [Flavobacteriales bacterium]|nr:hypothetical protein [Flavobacteriales bacterium]